MAEILKILSRPSDFFADEERINDTRTSLIIFGLAMATTSLIAAYYYSEKVIYYLELGELSNIPIQLLSVDYIIMSRLAYLFLAALIVLGVGRVFARLVNAERATVKAHLNVVFYSFLVILVMNLVSLPVILAYPVQQYGIVGASFDTVSFINASIVAEDVASGFNVSASSTLITADRMDVKYINELGQPVKWSELNSTEVKQILETRLPSVYLHNAKIFTYGDKVFNLTVSKLSFGEMKFRRTIDLERVLLNKEDIAGNRAAVTIELMGAFIPFITWIWFVAVNAIGFRAIFKVSGGKAIMFALFSFIVLVILGIL